MTAPRQVIPGTTYLVTRRCTQRQLLLRPDPITNRIFLFCLAVAAKRHGVLVHAACCMSNHVHLLITDPRGEMPEFEEWLNKFVAKCMNVHRRRFENFWAFPSSYSAVHLEGEEDFLRKLVYVTVNPVQAGLVAFGAQWPGVRFAVGGIGRQSYTVERPTLYFSRLDSLFVPAKGALTLSRPPKFFRTLSDEDFSEKVRTAAFEREKVIREEFRLKQKSFLGRAEVLAQSPFAIPQNNAPRFKLNPRIACIDKWKRVEAIQALAEFLKGHAMALKEWVAGNRSVVFPFGTYWMGVFHRARCAPAPT